MFCASRRLRGTGGTGVTSAGGSHWPSTKPCAVSPHLCTYHTSTQAQADSERITEALFLAPSTATHQSRRTRTRAQCSQASMGQSNLAPRPIRARIYAAAGTLLPQVALSVVGICRCRKYNSQLRQGGTTAPRRHVPPTPCHWESGPRTVQYIHPKLSAFPVVG